MGQSKAKTKAHTHKLTFMRRGRRRTNAKWAHSQRHRKTKKNTKSPLAFLPSQREIQFKKAKARSRNLFGPLLPATATATPAQWA